MRKTLYSLFAAALLLGGVAFANAWTPPPGAAPTCPGGTPGCDAPINTGTTAQGKTGALGIGTLSPATLFNISGAHGTTRLRLTLPAANNGASTGDVNLQAWVSEPGVTWEGTGIGANVNNDGGANGFGRLNTGLGQAFVRFLPNGGSINFYTTANNGIHYANTLSIGGGVAYVNGSAICTANGTNCPAGAGGVTFGGMFVPGFSGQCAAGPATYYGVNNPWGGCGCPTWAPQARPGGVVVGFWSGAWQGTSMTYYCTN
jgi:hypothetical protein